MLVSPDCSIVSDVNAWIGFGNANSGRAIREPVTTISLPPSPVSSGPALSAAVAAASLLAAGLAEGSSSCCELSGAPGGVVGCDWALAGWAAKAAIARARAEVVVEKRMTFLTAD